MVNIDEGLEIYQKLKYYESKLGEIYRKAFTGSIWDFRMLQEEITSDLELAQQFTDDEELRDLAERVSEQMRKLDETNIEELLE